MKKKITYRISQAGTKGYLTFSNLKEAKAALREASVIKTIIPGSIGIHAKIEKVTTELVRIN